MPCQHRKLRAPLRKLHRRTGAVVYDKQESVGCTSMIRRFSGEFATFAVLTYFQFIDLRESS
jgi:hypothetical protein